MCFACFIDKRFTKGHRSTRSVSSLPSELQNLSLNGPNPGNQGASSTTTSPKDESQVGKPQPSWMTGPPSVLLATTNSVSSSPPPPSGTNYQQYQHQRSVSDLSTHQPQQNQHGLMSATQQSPSSLSPFQFNHQNQSQNHHYHHHHHHPHPKQQQRQRHLSHRRAISATTVDHMMRPSSNAPPMPPLPFNHRAHSNSPPEEHLSLDTNKSHQPLDDFMDTTRTKMDTLVATASPATAPSSAASADLSSSSASASASPPPATMPVDSITPTHATVNGMDLPRDAVTGRYLCPYCQKPFSRPSSLRIHTYSHTGEKPFVCSECPRRFSVQSNMRRHLRIHFIRPTNKSIF
ncbi:hypothetical protein [Absidia glauca]|uniref:C2H2-type domain-containing protein n=1 Tax=Absidia glauca TaxID=4829 RepID=A0A168N6X7_ABSGL|nr:hypothetical protein [Absidia glauca]